MLAELNLKFACKKYLLLARIRKEFVHLTGEFEKQVKKLCLDPKAEKELIDMINKATAKTNAFAANPKKTARTSSCTKNGSTPTTVTAVHKPDLVILQICVWHLFSNRNLN
jgi:hypothetical protein